MTSQRRSSAQELSQREEKEKFCPLFLQEFQSKLILQGFQTPILHLAHNCIIPEVVKIKNMEYLQALGYNHKFKEHGARGMLFFSQFSNSLEY